MSIALMANGQQFDFNTLSEIKNAVIDAIYPVGSVIINTTGTNPGTWLGVGAWEQYAQGRTLIGVGTGNDGSTSKTFTVSAEGGYYESQEISIGDPKWAPATTTTTSGYADRYLIRRDSDTFPPATSGERKARVSLQSPYKATYFWKRTA